MADITMCTQTLCPNSGHCYRVQAKASDWQSMATFDYTISERGVECDNYMPIYRTVATDSTRHDDWSVAREAADEIERLRKLLDRIAVRNPDGSVAIRLTDDALNAAAEYLTPNAA